MTLNKLLKSDALDDAVPAHVFAILCATATALPHRLLIQNLMGLLYGPSVHSQAISLLHAVSLITFHQILQQIVKDELGYEPFSVSIVQHRYTS